MLPHGFPLRRRQVSGFVEQFERNGDLADVVEQARFADERHEAGRVAHRACDALADSGDAEAVHVEVGIEGLHRRGQEFDDVAALDRFLDAPCGVLRERGAPFGKPGGRVGGQ